MKATEKREEVRDLINRLYNASDDERLRTPLMRAYKRLDDAETDVDDLAARAAGAVNYLRLTKQLQFTPQQEKLWRELRDAGSATVLDHDPKNNLLDLSEE